MSTSDNTTGNDNGSNEGGLPFSEFATHEHTSGSTGEHTGSAEHTSAGTTTQEAAAPSGSKYDDVMTFTLRPSFRGAVKFMTGAAAYIALAVAASALLTASGNLPVLLYLMVYVAVVYGMLYVSFVYLFPLTNAIVDKTFAVVNAGWTKFKNVFKRAEVAAEAGVEAAAEAAHTPVAA